MIQCHQLQTGGVEAQLVKATWSPNSGVARPNPTQGVREI